MTIKVIDYIIKDSLGVKCFDVYKEHLSKSKKTGEEKIVETNIAWGVKIEKAIDIIVQDRMKTGEDILYLQDFLEKYKEYNKELLEEIESKIKVHVQHGKNRRLD